MLQNTPVQRFPVTQVYILTINRWIMTISVVDYVYLPIWFISYRYRDKDYIFAMNGQTGKVIGEPPVSRGKVAGWFAGISAAAFAILMVIGGLL